MTQLFFGVGTGRVASMSFANALNCEQSCICLHEGKVRDFELSGEQVLPFLTLQNRLAYEYPEKARAFVDELRGNLGEIAASHGLTHLGDIAYYYAPFVGALHEYFQNAKFLFLYRDCLDFVRSCTAVDTIDDTPVGWPPETKPLSPVEQFIALGRLQPRESSEEAEAWAGWDYVTRNIWLWAETNRIILRELVGVSEELKIFVSFDDFKRDPLREYGRVRDFLEFDGVIPDDGVKRLTSRPINKRCVVRNLTFAGLTASQKDVWEKYAAPIRLALGYV
jgi:hypothetical protein